MNCQERIEEQLNNEIETLQTLWDLYCEDSEAYDDDLGCFTEYGLAFDYVPAETFDNQEGGYFRYQISYGGPSDEFRFFVDLDYTPYKIEYWFLDWFDGAKKILGGTDEDLLREIFQWFGDVGAVESEYKKA